MTVLLATRDLKLLSAMEFALQSKGFAVIPAVPNREITIQLLESGADIIVLDVGFGRTRTSKMVEQVKRDPRLAGTALILFSTSRARLKEAFTDRDVVNKADDVLAEMSDEFQLIDRINSAAQRLRMERARHKRQASQWKGPFGATCAEERREDERFGLDAPVTIEGKDVLGEPFDEETRMLNIGASGAYLKSKYHVEENTGLEMSVRDPRVPGGTFDVKGTVLRTGWAEDRSELKSRRLAIRFADDAKRNIALHLLLARLSDEGSD